MEKVFETWVFKGVRYLAVPGEQDGNEYVRICDEFGSYFGSFICIENFRKRQNSNQSWSCCRSDAKVLIL